MGEKELSKLREKRMRMDEKGGEGKRKEEESEERMTREKEGG